MKPRCFVKEMVDWEIIFDVIPHYLAAAGDSAAWLGLACKPRLGLVNQRLWLHIPHVNFSPSSVGLLVVLGMLT
jgi:hypothetical protein